MGHCDSGDDSLASRAASTTGRGTCQLPCKPQCPGLNVNAGCPGLQCQCYRLRPPAMSRFLSSMARTPAGRRYFCPPLLPPRPPLPAPRELISGPACPMADPLGVWTSQFPRHVRPRGARRRSSCGLWLLLPPAACPCICHGTATPAANHAPPAANDAPPAGPRRRSPSCPSPDASGQSIIQRRRDPLLGNAIRRLLRYPASRPRLSRRRHQPPPAYS